MWVVDRSVAMFHDARTCCGQTLQIGEPELISIEAVSSQWLRILSTGPFA